MSEEKEEKKKSKKGLIIVLLLIIIIAAAVVTAVILTSSSSSDKEKALEETKTTGVEWGDNYYLYLLEDFENDITSELPIDGLEEVEIGFVEIKDFEFPVMLIEGLLDDEPVYTIAYIEDNEINTAYIYSEESAYKDTEYLYNVENEEYDWYICTESEDYTYYVSIEDYIDSEKDNAYVYLIDDTEIENDSNFVDDITGDFDREFVETNVELALTEIDLSNKDNLLTSIATAVGVYVENENLLTENDAEEIEEKIEEISNLLTDEEALEIGYDLYTYGERPVIYDTNTSSKVLGKSGASMDTWETLEDTENIYEVYKFASNSDVDDYFTESRLSELTLEKLSTSYWPYALEKVDGTWNYIIYPTGGNYEYIGTMLKIANITEDEITFFAISFYSKDLPNADSDIYLDTSYTATVQENINNISEDYECHISVYEFVIKLEDEHWKIDQQVVAN